ncbi:hypothetical protein [Pseudofrankia inefficax]|uniref:hypothetical protein n=1 Tax=Pseudofrankia inefficax (strain DSM 45817 / CECT 9037 / DDB 130130 / EuI1c) TaxID=298654 RepID=UPI0012FD3539|nr:hypothetical protein [Pseudofrankia inefficax]
MLPLLIVVFAFVNVVGYVMAVLFRNRYGERAGEWTLTVLRIAVSALLIPVAFIGVGVWGGIGMAVVSPFVVVGPELIRRREARKAAAIEPSRAGGVSDAPDAERASRG